MAPRTSGLVLNYASISDPNLRTITKLIVDKLNTISGGVSGPAWQGHLNAGAYNLTNLADGINPTDAVTKAQLDAATNLSTIVQNIQAGGTNPINVTNLPGAGGTLTFGTHATRLTTPASSNTFWFETDRNALYGANGSVWTVLVSSMRGTSASRPSDLGTNDGRFNYFQVDTVKGNVMWQWNGSSWHFVLGAIRDTLSNLPVAADAYEGAYFEATDYDRIFYCTGLVWQNAVGQLSQGTMCLFQSDPGTGWALCDGSSVTMSQPDGSTTSYATLDFVTNDPFVRTSGATGSGTFGTTGTDYHYTQALMYVRL